MRLIRTMHKAGHRGFETGRIGSETSTVPSSRASSCVTWRRWASRLALAVLIAGLSLPGQPEAFAAGEGAAAQELTSVEEILKRVDQHMTFDSRSTSAKMIIVSPDETREKELRIFSRGEHDSFMVFQKPLRDKGTKFLKLEAQLWTYFPKTEKTVKISGHMLRQSMMGSDFSYEDMTENRRLLDMYNASLLPAENVNGDPCYVIQLKEKVKGLSYPERKQWVSKKSFIPLREERYAKTGRLLKVVSLDQIQQFGGRYYPTRFVVEDKLKIGTRTELLMQDLKFGVDVPQDVFNIRNLEREVTF